MTVRSVIKSAVTGIGLYPLFVGTRRTYFRWRERIFKSPLDLLLMLSHGYISLMWMLKPDWRWIRDYVTHFLESYSYTVKGNDSTFVFYTPNSVTQHRAETFFTKEPETLEWIDEYAKGGILCDIGANVGPYTIYHAVRNSGVVYAFEPCVFNLPTLVRNINVNKVQSLVTVFPIALTQTDGPDLFECYNTEVGGATNGFGVSYGPTGNFLAHELSYRIAGVSLDSMLESGQMPSVPRAIKIDVDGIEHLIVAGARKVLSHPECISVLVEMDERFALQHEVVPAILKECGFRFKEKRRSPMFANLVENGRDIGCFNHIFVKG